MDYTAFIHIFTSVYGLYIRIHTWLHPKPKQLFFYDEARELLFTSGYHNYDLRDIKLDHFVISGSTYKIKINDEPIINIKNKNCDGFNVNKQYFLGSAYRVYNKPVKIEITDEFSDESATFNFNPHHVIDLKKLIKDMGDN